MSDNSGIYVLLTETDKGPEYRVAYSGCIDNIYGKYSDQILNWEGNREMIRETFGNSDVFYSLDLALDKAEEMSQNYEYLEDGVAVISTFKHLKDVFLEE